jgi:hypothetical protein
MLNDAAGLLKRRSVMTAMAMILRYRSFEVAIKTGWNLWERTRCEARLAWRESSHINV